jgi:hypothetical protein
LLAGECIQVVPAARFAQAARFLIGERRRFVDPRMGRAVPRMHPPRVAMAFLTKWMAPRVRVDAALLFGALATAACGGGSATAAPATTAESLHDGDAMATRKAHYRYPHHGGVTIFIAMSLDTLGVSPGEQAAVEKIRTELNARMDPERLAEQSLVAALADGVATGKLEPATVDAAMMRVSVAAATVHEASADAVNELHGVLTPPQRSALVDKVEAHWAVWLRANNAETGPYSENDSQLDRLAPDLGLTVDQVKKIRAGLGERMSGVPRIDPQEIAAHLHAFGEAFRSDTFDARKLITGGDLDARVARWGAAHLAHFVEVAILVLTSDQRTVLAQRLRDHAAEGPIAQRRP